MTSPEPQPLVSSSKFGPKLTEAQRRAIVSEVASGRRQCDVAQQFGVTPGTVCTLVKSVRQTAQSAVFAADWRMDQQSKAIVAVNAGLDCSDDPYKRGSLGATVLKGLGLYQADSVQQVAVMFGSVPKELEEEYNPVDIEAERAGLAPPPLGVQNGDEA